MNDSGSLVLICQSYIKNVLSQVQGLKVLFLDEFTTSAVSLVYSQSEILEKETYLVEPLNSLALNEFDIQKDLKHLKAVFFIRPTPDNVAILVAELKKARLGATYIYFTAPISNKQLERIAKGDVHQLVKSVQHLFCDYLAICPELFSLNIPNSTDFMINPFQSPARHNLQLEFISQGILSVIISACRHPITHIRYPKYSSICQSLSENLKLKLLEEKEFLHLKNDTAEGILLLFNRCDDPLTPLLSQWTYQAMVHELIGIENNIVKIPAKKGAQQPEEEQLVLSSLADEFFATHRYSTFGELGTAVTELVKRFQRQHGTAKSDTMSLEGMRDFMDGYKEFRKASQDVNKHVKLVHLLSQLAEAKGLLNISLLEQEIACLERQNEHCQSVLNLINSNNSISKYDLLRLALIYAVKYENDDSVVPIKAALENAGIRNDALDSMAAYVGDTKRMSSFLRGKSFFQIAKNAVQRGIQGVSNVYTQHRSFLSVIVDSLCKNKLKESLYDSMPIFDNSLNGARPAQIIVFVVGGATYEEAFDLARLSQQTNLEIILGGTTIHNSKSFLAEVTQLKAQTSVIEGKSNQLKPSLHHAMKAEKNRQTDVEEKRKFILDQW